MCFFRKALKSLETIEPQVKLTTEQQYIDYNFSGLEDDDRDSVFLSDDDDEEDDSDDNYDTIEDGELNIASSGNVRKNEVSTSGNSMEARILFPVTNSIIFFIYIYIFFLF